MDELQQSGLDPNYLLFFMYTESLKHIAEHSKAGHTIFLNNHPSMPQDILAQMSTFYKPATTLTPPPATLPEQIDNLSG